MTTQQSKILEWLEYYGDKGMTVYQSILNGCGTELRTNVTKMKRMGYDIQSRWVTKNGKHFKEYYLAGN